MKKISILFSMSLFSFIVLFLWAFSSCGRPCIEPRGIEGAGLTISFFNTTNDEYFYTENPSRSPFRLDSLKVTDSNGQLLRTPNQLDLDPRNPLSRIYVVDIYPIFIPSDDQAAYTSEKEKFIYIQYNYNTFDTLRLIYKTKEGKCANKYEYLKAYYKNNLIAESYNSYSQGLLFTLSH